MVDRFVYITDTHFTLRGVSSRKDDYYKVSINKLKFILQYMQKKNIKNLLHGGDLLDHPNIADKVAGKVAGLMSEASVDFGFKLFIIKGNHDISGKNPDTYINGKLNLFEKYKWFNFIGSKNIEFPNTIISGIDYTKEGEEQLEHYLELTQEQQKKTKILMLHLMVIGKKKSLIIDGHNYGISYRDIVTDADITLCGHNHLGFGIKKITELAHKRYIINPCSMMRTNSHEASLGAKPHLVDIIVKKDKQFKCKLIEIPHEDDVFVKSEKKYSAKDILTDKQFIKRLEELKTCGMSNDNLDTILKSLLKKEFNTLKGEKFIFNKKILDYIKNTRKELENG
jgi:DNA repair exonuclease SbcCD nuclease subunit